jgi:hypothetical protein
MSTSKILVVEDDVKLARLLPEDRYVADACAGGSDGIGYVSRN